MITTTISRSIRSSLTIRTSRTFFAFGSSSDERSGGGLGKPASEELQFNLEIIALLESNSPPSDDDNDANNNGNLKSSRKLLQSKLALSSLEQFRGMSRAERRIAGHSVDNEEEEDDDVEDDTESDYSYDSDPYVDNGFGDTRLEARETLAARTRLHNYCQSLNDPHLLPGKFFEILTEEIGHSLELKDSTLECAGKGLFVTGSVKKGSIVGYFPGVFFLREDLAIAGRGGEGVLDRVLKMVGGGEGKAETNVLDYLAVDPHFNIQGRSDGEGILDCRDFTPSITSVAKIDKSKLQKQHIYHRNPIALAHFSNHDVVRQNAVAVPIDFPRSSSGSEETFSRSLLRSFVPNSYWRPPSVLGGVMSRTTGMNGVCLVATEDVAGGEEVFVDYKLRGEGLKPDWYV